MKIRSFIAIGVSSWLLTTAPSLIAADEILFEEGFNTDGEGTRYTSEGRLVSEIADHVANGVTVDQVGPVYWGLSSEVSIVGVPGPTAARRVVITWHHDLTADDVTTDGLEMLDATIAWLTGGKASPRVLFTPAPMGTGDDVIVDRLKAGGATVTNDEDTAGALPPVADFDLVIHSSQTSTPSRFTNYAVPYLTYNAPDHDDELLGTIGASETRNVGNVTVASPEHPAAGGKTGSIQFFTGEVLADFPGTEVPDGSSVIASYPIVDVPPVTSLADVEMMVSGEIETVVSEGTIPSADIESGDGGNFDANNAPPGNPVGSFVTVSTGSFKVKEPGTYGIALWVAGGGSLRIDVDGNGLDASDTVITQDTVTIVDGLIESTSNYADVAFSAAGDYAFDWVAYSPTVVMGSEIFFTFVAGADQRDGLDDQEIWAPLADWEANGITVLPINLNGEIAVKTYEQPAQVIEERPLIVAINGPDEGGQVFGGGAFIDAEGEAFFAGSGLNKFLGEIATKSVTLNPVNVAGQTGLKLKLLVAATTLDFETSDLLDVLIDPNNSGTFQPLVHFTAPSGNDKFFSDGKTDLNIAFQEITVDIPDGATDLVIRVEAVTTWWNEVVAFDYIRVVKEAEFADLWLLGDDANGNQTEFSQEQGMDAAPGSATAQDDDFYFWGVYPDPIGTVTENEPFLNFDRAHVPGDPFNRIHFNLDAESAAADTELRMTFGLCCFGAADDGPSDHNLVFRLNGKEFFSEDAVNGDRVIEEVVVASDFGVVEGVNTIEIERTGGSDSAWVQYDYIRLEATAGEPVPQPTAVAAGIMIVWDAVNPDTTATDLIGGSSITFVPKQYPGSNSNAMGTFFTGDGGTTGNAELDTVYDTHGWAPEGTAITLEGLTAGEVYKVQLLGAGDTRACCDTRNQAASDGQGNVSGDFGRGNSSVVGTFTAGGETQDIQIISGTDNGVDPGLSGYIVTDANGVLIEAVNTSGDVDVTVESGGGGGGETLDVLFLGADDTGETGADANVLAFLGETFGVANTRYQRAGAADGSETADVIVFSSTFGSGDVRGKFHNSPVPIVNWEEAVMDTADGEFGQSLAVMTKSTDTTQMALGDHPIAGDLAGTTIDYLTAAGVETVGSTELSSGTDTVGTGVDGAIAGLAMLFVTEAGAAVADTAGITDNVSPARRVAFPMTDVTFDSLTDAGKQLFANSIRWAAGTLSDGNLLANGSFEEPVLDNINTNNLGTVPTGWSQTGDDVTWNLIRNDGTPYGSGVDNAADGSQIIDLNGIFEIFQNFTVPSDATVTFGASFSNREGHDGSDPSTVGIYDASGANLLSPVASVDTSAESIPSDRWLSGQESVSLTAGEYQIRIALNNFNNVDAVFVRFGSGGDNGGGNNGGIGGDRFTTLQDVGITANGVFGITIPDGATADIEYSTDLVNWEAIAPGVTGAVEETDSGRIAAPAGFYRGVQP